MDQIMIENWTVGAPEEEEVGSFGGRGTCFFFREKSPNTNHRMMGTQGFLDST
jgi:hypothetical protein